ncbi:MAG TPA: NADPH-dependent 7-cyano-7-deazaguanine reductase QueF [Victivallales bacterium]|nr:NADPH-dependent 7-cyano-7-deazaguanine reductase QueF [Victivallales bacterium]
MDNHLSSSLLGKEVNYNSSYEPDILFPIPRISNRKLLGLSNRDLPFKGWDVWNCYELSWLNTKGKPDTAIVRFVIPYNSEHIIESKSFKLYINSFNNTKFSSILEVKNVLKNDISKAVGAKIQIEIYNENSVAGVMCIDRFDGICIDDIDISCDSYLVDSSLLTATDENVVETLYSNLLKSNCPVTGQPDWASVQFSYKGKKIKHENLLKYIISYRNHTEFHELCVERMFVDIMKKCNPDELTVYARYTRRGGLDINPIRSNCLNVSVPKCVRLYRQ